MTYFLKQKILHFETALVTPIFKCTRADFLHADVSLFASTRASTTK